MVKFYCSSPSGEVNSQDYSFPSNATVVYDSVVDKSQFRPDSEQVRLFKNSGQGSSGNPHYDSDNGDEMPTDLEVRIRTGKLDKAEISQIQQGLKNDIKSDVSDTKKELKKKKLEDVSQARQEYLDKATGFKGSEQNQTS